MFYGKNKLNYRLTSILAALILVLVLCPRMGVPESGKLLKKCTYGVNSTSIWKAEAILDLSAEVNIRSIVFLFFQPYAHDLDIIFPRLFDSGVQITTLVSNHDTASSLGKHLKNLSGRGNRYLIIVEGSVQELQEMWTQVAEDIVWGTHWILFGTPANFTVVNSVFAGPVAFPSWIETAKRKSQSKNHKCYDIYVWSYVYREDMSGISFHVPARRRVGSSFKKALLYQGLPSLQGRKIVLATNEFAPFISTEMDKNQTLRLTGGIDAKLILTLQEKFKFRLNVMKPKDGEWGIPKHGNWSGLIGALQKKNADVAVSCLSQTAERTEVVDFSVIYHTEDFALVVKKPQPKSKVFAVVMPFTTVVWISIIVALIGGIMLLYILGKIRYHHMTTQNKPSFGSIIWTLFGTAVNQSCSMTNFRGLYAMAFLAVWFWFAFVIRVSYTAPLTSFMTFPGYEPAINTFEDLAKVMRRSSTYGCGAIKGSNNYASLLDLNGSLKIIADRVRKDERSALKSTKEGLYRVVHEEFAVVLPKSSSKFEASAGGLRNIRVTRGVLNKGLTSVAVRKGFPHRLAFNIIIRRLVEMGFVRKWRNDEILKARRIPEDAGTPEKTTIDPFPTHHHTKSMSEVKPLAFTDMKGVFLLLLCGYACAFVMCVAKYFQHKLRKIDCNLK